MSLFGPPRTPETPFDNQEYADIAASIQRVTEELVLGLASAAHARTGSTALCMAGGVALNSVANGRILRETPIREMYIQPSAGDGGARRRGAVAARALLSERARFAMHHAYWGEEHGDAAVADAAASTTLPHAPLRTRTR